MLDRAKEKAKEKLGTAKLRLKQVKDHNREKGRDVLGHYAKEKIRKAKEDRRFAAIYLVEFAFILLILFSIAIFLDEETKAALAKYLSQGEQFLPAPYSYLAFALVIVIVFLLYRYTSEFRKVE